MTQRLTCCQWRCILRILRRVGQILSRPEGDGILLGDLLVQRGSKLNERNRLIYNLVFPRGIHECTNLQALAAKANSFGLQLTGIIRRAVLSQWRARVQQRSLARKSLSFKLTLSPILARWKRALALKFKEAALRSYTTKNEDASWLLRSDALSLIRIWRQATQRRKSITEKLIQFQLDRYQRRSLQAYKLWGLATACSRHFENELIERHGWFTERRFMEYWCQAFVVSRRAARVQWNYETRILERCWSDWKQAQSNKHVERLGTDFALVGALALWRRNAWHRRRRRRVRERLQSRLLLRPIINRWIVAGKLRLKASLLLSRRQSDRALKMLQLWKRRATRLAASRSIAALLLHYFKSASFYKLAHVSRLLDQKFESIASAHGRRVCSKALKIWKHRRWRSAVVAARGLILSAVRAHRGMSLRSRLSDDVCLEASLLRVQWTRLQNIAVSRITRAFYDWLNYSKRYKTTKARLKSLEENHERRALSYHLKSWKKAVAVSWIGENCLLMRQRQSAVSDLRDWNETAKKRVRSRAKMLIIKETHTFTVLRNTLLSWAQTFADLEKVKAVLYAFREERELRESKLVFERWRIWSKVCGNRHRLSSLLDVRIARIRLRRYFMIWCTQYASHVKLRSTLKPLLDLVVFQARKFILRRWKAAVSFDRLGDITLRRRILTKYLRAWRTSSARKVDLKRKRLKLEKRCKARLLSLVISHWLSTLRLKQRLDALATLVRQNRDARLLREVYSFWSRETQRERRNRDIQDYVYQSHCRLLSGRHLRLWMDRLVEKDLVRERLLKAIVGRRGERETETETSASSGLGDGRALGDQMRSLLACSSTKEDVSEGLSSFPMLSSPRGGVTVSSPFNSVFQVSEGTQFVSAVSERHFESSRLIAPPVCVSLATATVCYLASTGSKSHNRTDLQWRRVLVDMRDTHALDAPIDIRGFVRLACLSKWEIELEFLARIFVHFMRSGRLLKLMRAGLYEGGRRRQRCRELCHVLRLQMASRWLVIWRYILEREESRHLCIFKTIQSRKALRLIPKWHESAQMKIARKDEAILLHVHQQMDNGRDTLRDWRHIVKEIARRRDNANLINKRWKFNISQVALLSWRCLRVRSRGLRKLESVHKMVKRRMIYLGVKRRLCLRRRLQFGVSILTRLLLKQHFRLAFKDDLTRCEILTKWKTVARRLRTCRNKQHVITDYHQKRVSRNMLCRWRREASRLTKLRRLLMVHIVRRALSCWKANLIRVHSQIGAETSLQMKIRSRYFQQWKQTAKIVTTSRIIRKIQMYSYWIKWKSEWQTLLWAGLARDRLERLRVRRIMTNWLTYTLHKKETRDRRTTIETRHMDYLTKKIFRLWVFEWRGRQALRGCVERLCLCLNRIGCRESFEALLLARETGQHIADLGVVVQTMMKIRLEGVAFGRWKMLWRRRKSTSTIVRLFVSYQRRRLLADGFDGLTRRVIQTRIVNGTHKLTRLFAKPTFKLRLALIHLWRCSYDYEARVFQWKITVDQKALKQFQTLLRQTVCQDRRDKLKKAVDAWASICRARDLAQTLTQKTNRRRLDRSLKGWAILTLKLSVERQKILILETRHRLPRLIEVLSIWRRETVSRCKERLLTWSKNNRDASRILVVWLLAVQTEKYEQKVCRLFHAQLRPLFLRQGLEAFVWNVLDRHWQQQVDQAAIHIKADIVYHQALDAVRFWREYAVGEKHYRRLSYAHDFALLCAAIERWREVTRTRRVGRSLSSKARPKQNRTPQAQTTRPAMTETAAAVASAPSVYNPLSAKSTILTSLSTKVATTKPSAMISETGPTMNVPLMTRLSPLQSVLSPPTLTSMNPEQVDHLQQSGQLENARERHLKQLGIRVSLTHRRETLLKAWLVWKWRLQMTEETTEPSSQDILAFHTADKSSEWGRPKQSNGERLPVTGQRRGTLATRDVKVFNPSVVARLQEIEDTDKELREDVPGKITSLSKSILDPFSSRDEKAGPKMFGGGLAASDARMDRVSKRLGISTIDLAKIDEHPLTTINVEQFLQDEIDYLQQQTKLLSPPSFGK